MDEGLKGFRSWLWDVEFFVLFWFACLSGSLSLSFAVRQLRPKVQ